MIALGIARKALRDTRGAAIGAGVAVFLVVLLHAASFPSYDQLQGMHYPDALKGIFGEAGSISSPEGYTGAYLSNLTVLLAIFAIVLGTGATASEEGAGTLDLLLSQPIGRPRLLLSKAAGLVLGMAFAVVAALPAFLLGGLVVDQQMSAWRFLATVVSLVPFVALFLSFGLWTGALLSTRAVAGTVSAAVVVVMYFLNAVGGVVDFLSMPRRLSPFYWIDTSHVLLHGFDWTRSGGLIAVALVLLLLAVRSFTQREISVGARSGGWAWPGTVAHPAAKAAATTSTLGGAYSRRLGIVRKAVRDVRGAAIGAGIGTFLLVVLDVLIYPAFSDALKSYQYPEVIRGMLGEAGSIASPEGFMTVEFFSLVPLLFATLAIVAGTAATAGEEGAGTLDLIVSGPIRRHRLLLGKWAGTLLALFVATLAAVPGFLISRPISGMDLPLSRFLAALVNVLSLEFLFLAVALWAGALLPNRSAAVLASTSAMVGSFLLPTFAAVSDVLETARNISPFYWADASRALIHGFDPLRALSSFALGAVFLALAVWTFEKRDIGTGGREWRLPPWRLSPVRRRPPLGPFTEVGR